MQQTKPADSAGRKEKAGKKEAKKATVDASITTNGTKGTLTYIYEFKEIVGNYS